MLRTLSEVHYSMGIYVETFESMVITFRYIFYQIGETIKSNDTFSVRLNSKLHNHQMAPPVWLLQNITLSSQGGLFYNVLIRTLKDMSV